MAIIRGAALMILAFMAGCQSKGGGAASAPGTPAAAQTGIASPGPAAVSAEPVRSKGLPDPKLTPGEREPRPRKRSAITPAAQQKVLRAYGIDSGDTQPVVCRLIPPEIGGTDSPKNLFVTTPWFAGLKARLDKKLVALVESKEITAEQAEKDLKRDWVKAAHKYYVRNYGEGDRAAAKKKEDENRW